MNFNWMGAGFGWLGLLLCFAWTGCGGQVELTAAVPHEGAQRVKGTRISLVKPEGFSQAPSFAGYVDVETGCSIMVMELDGPYSEVARGFNDPDALKAQNMKIQERGAFAQGMYPGLLLQVEQEAMGTAVRKWVWVFGSEARSVMVMATCPQASIETEFEKLGRAVRTTSWEPELILDVVGEMGFFLGDTGGMKLMPGLTTSLSYSPDGEIDQDGAQGKPFFMVTPALAPTPTSAEEYGTRRIRMIPGHKKVRAEEPTRIQIDGLRGYECVASSIHRKSDEEAFIYQVLLFEGTSYWNLTGTARERDRDTYLPIFRRMANSFQRKYETVMASDGKTSIVVPSNWTLRSDMDEEADIQAGQPIAGMYALVYRDSKADLGEDASFEIYAQKAQARLGERANSQGDEIAMKIQGLRATRLTYQMQEDGVPSVYLLGVVEGAEDLYQVVLWCRQEGELYAMDEFVRVLESLREVE